MERTLDLLFVSFDIRKDEYPAMTYSIAALVAPLRSLGYRVAHISFDLQHSLEERTENRSLTDMVKNRLSESLEYFMKFRYIAVSLTAWSIEYCEALQIMLKDYPGKLILGGYEVTAMTDEMLLKAFPRTDYFIKGFAETALKKLLAGDYSENGIVIEEPIDDTDMDSPYLTGVLPMLTRKIHWETQRGCPYRCGFCEWGNASKKPVPVNEERLWAEIEMMSRSGLEEVNILDGTFNYGRRYLGIFKRLLNSPD